MVHLRIRDYGPGAPNPDDVWQFKKRQTTQSNGSGIGLYFVKRAIQGIGGKISAYNGTAEDGGGLIFDITLTAVTEEELARFMRYREEELHAGVGTALASMTDIYPKMQDISEVD